MGYSSYCQSVLGWASSDLVFGNSLLRCGPMLQAKLHIYHGIKADDIGPLLFPHREGPIT